ncbi:MAG: hypothetical protein NT085_01070 [candidate division SR1 bacterium]|nr:hypothetical protein [candidate division SR1 bacterium]
MLSKKNRISSLKYLLLVLVPSFFLVGFFTNASITIPDSISSALQVIQRILVTSDGNDTGTPIMDINSGGNVVVYAPLKNGLGHSFITSESDPIFSASVAAGITSNQIYNRNTAYLRGDHRAMGYLTGETDPVWNIDKLAYYTKTDVDNLLAGFAGGLTYKGVWEYSTGDLPMDIILGDFYKISVSGDFNGLVLYAGDMIIANRNLSGVTSMNDRDVIRNVNNPEVDPVFAASVAAGISSTQLSHWDTSYSRGDHSLAGYLKTETDPIRNTEKSNYYTINEINAKGYLTNYSETDPMWNAEKNNYYTTGEIDAKGYLTNFVETDPTWLSDKSNYYTTFQVDSLLSGLDFANHTHDDRYYTKSQINAFNFLTGYTETDPEFLAHSGDYYPITNPSGYITTANVSWTKHGSDIINTNTGNVFINKYLNIGGVNETYPLYVRSANTDDFYSNYITIDGPDTVEKGFQIGGGSTSEDYKWAMYTASGEDGDKLYFANGNSKRDVITISAAGRVGINNPTLLGSTTPLDAFTLYPQYFDYAARYDGDTYYDETANAYTSAGDPFVLVNGPGDAFLCGKEYPRRSIYIDIETPAGTPGTLQVKYSKTGGGWGDAVGLTDKTDKFKQDGNIGWTIESMKPTWEKRTINGHNLYWIKLSLSSLAGNAPTAKLMTNLGVNRFSLYAGAGDVSPMFTIDSNSRVGLLPPELTTKYEMGKLPGIADTKMEVVSNDNDQYTTVHYLADPVADEKMSIVFAKSKGTVSDKLSVSNTDILGGIYGFGYDGGTFRQAAGITFGVDGAPDVLDMPGKISFSTSLDGTTEPLERMIIKNNGRVGIGTSSPTQALTVSGNINVTSGHTIYDGSGNPYITAVSLIGYLTGETDPIWTTLASSYYTATQVNEKIASVVGAMTYKGGWDYSTGVLPSDVNTGDMYIITNETGVEFSGLHMEAPDQIIAKRVVSGATETGDWNLIEMDQPETDPIFLASPAHAISTLTIGHWNAAYGRGNHADAGYLKTETDPLFAISEAAGITSGDVSHWDAAYSRGDHRDMGYITSYTETDPVWSAAAHNYYTRSQIDNQNYLTGYTESDPIYLASSAANVTTGKIINWDAAYGRGDHTSAGYLTAAAISGFITGPDSSADNALVRFHGTNGKIIQDNSNVRLTDSGAFYPVTDSATAIQFNEADKTTNVLSIDTVNNRINGDTAFQLGLGLSVGAGDGGTSMLEGNFQNPFFSVGQHQNYLLQSEVFDNASWVKTNIGAVTANSAQDPMGTATAENIPAGTLATSNIAQSVTNAVVGNRTFAVRLKMQSVTGSVIIRVESNAQVGSDKVVNLTTQWKRFWVTQNLTTAHTTKIVRIVSGTGAYAAWGASLTPSNTPLPYYNTTTAGLTTLTNYVNIRPSAIIGGTLSIGSTLTVVGATTMAAVSATSIVGSSTITSTRSNIAAVSTDGLVNTNAQAATLAVPVQMSPRLMLNGNVWNAGSSATNTSQWIMENLPITGNPPNSMLQFGYSLAGGAMAYKMGLSSNGWLTVGNNNPPTSALDVAGDAEIPSTNRYYLGDPTTNGSWRMGLNGSSFAVQTRAGGVRSAGYYTGESDPIRTSEKANYSTTTQINARGFLTAESDPTRTTQKTSYYTKTEVDSKLFAVSGMAYQGTWDYSAGALPSSPLNGYYYVVRKAGNFNGLNMITGNMFIANKSKVGVTMTGDWDLIANSFIESDPIFAIHPAASITNTKITNRDSAYGRGDHRMMGYITGNLGLYMLLSGNQTVQGTITVDNLQNSAGTRYQAGAAYTIYVQALTASPADSVANYFGQIPAAPNTVALTRRVYITTTGTITAASISTYAGTAGTAEAWSMYVRKNDTTDYLIQTLSLATAERNFRNTAMNIPVVPGDFIEMKTVNPVWVTNPLTMIIGGYLYVQ